jgi:16S rRNA (guanine966-N2)-methyltransferase
MRVIAGTARGQHLKFPKGAPTRPATDMFRGVVFQILESLANDWSTVLDLFSGSGAIGIEALSRGAGSVDFVDRDPRCCAVIKENLTSTNLIDAGHVYCSDVSKAISFLDKQYDIVVMDPPYPDQTIGNVIEKLAQSKLTGTNTIVAVTHSSRFALESEYTSLHLVKERCHGDSCVNFYRKEGDR